MAKNRRLSGNRTSADKVDFIPNLATEHFTQFLAFTDGFCFGYIKQEKLHLEEAAVSACVDSTGARQCTAVKTVQMT